MNLPSDELSCFRAWYWDTPSDGRWRVYRNMLAVGSDATSSELHGLDTLLEFAAYYGDGRFNLYEISEHAVGSEGARVYEQEIIGALINAANSGSYARLYVKDLYYKDAFVGSGFDIELLWESFYGSWSWTLERHFPPDGNVYLLAAGGYHKIGRAKVVSDRVRQLGILLPYPVEIAHHFPCENHVQSERALHKMFADKRVRGEWFALEESDIALIQNISFMRGAAVEWECAE